MDGISVAASVMGLLQVGAKVIGFLSSVADAPSTARNVLAEVQALHAIFRQLDDFIVDFTQQSMTRKSRIYVEDLVCTLTGCVCTFSELDKELESLKTDDSDGSQFTAWNSMKWATKDQGLATILGNLQMHKTSLSLMLSVYTCASTQQAQREMAELKQLMTTVFQSNPDIAERMATFTSSGASDNPDSSSIRTALSIRSSSSFLSTSTAKYLRRFAFAFERTLGETRVYKRADKNTSTCTFKTIETARSSWSQLTGLSLAGISNISVIYLPVYSVELKNGYLYQQAQGDTDKGTTLFGRALSGRLSLHQFQGIRNASIRVSTTVRYHLKTAKGQISLLHSAARKGDTTTVQLLIHAGGVDKDVRDENGMTPLHQSARNNHGTTVRMLLDLGADVNTADNNHWTALHHSARSGCETTVELLLDRGADIEAASKTGSTALNCSAEYGHEATVRLLLDRDTYIEAVDRGDNGRTALHQSAWNGHEATVRLLLDHNADIEAADNNHWTALHHSATNGHEATVKLLLDRGANMKAVDYDVWTALHHSGLNGHEAIVRLLLDRGANIEASDKDSRTALHHSALKGHDAIVRLLLDRGADIEAANHFGQTVLQQSAKYGRETVVWLLLDRGAILEVTSDNGSTALHWSAEYGHEATVKLLLNNGARIGAADNDGWTALHRSAWNGHEATVRLLLDRGADIEAADNDCWTALHHSSSNGHEATVRVLLDYGADIEAADNDGWTVLHHSATGNYGNKATIRLLLDHGADIKAANKIGWTVLDIATYEYKDVLLHHRRVSSNLVAAPIP